MDTTKTAGHNPNKVQATTKPMAHEKLSNPPEPSVFGNNLSEFIDFLKDTWSEFRKISWPNREQTLRETWSVLVLVAAITLSVLAFDWVIGKAVFDPIDKFAKKMGGGVGHTMMPTAAPFTVPAQPASAPTAPASSAPVAPATTPAAPAPETPSPAGNSTTPATPAPASSSPAPAPSPTPTSPTDSGSK